MPTRLGDGSVDVEVEGKLISPFTGETIDALSIRANWIREAEPVRALLLLALMPPVEHSLVSVGYNSHMEARVFIGRVGWPVSKRVNSSRASADDASLIERI